MASHRDLFFWAAVLAGLVFLLWLLSPILLPFVLGIAIAYIVDPLVVWLERHGVSRGVAAALLVGSSFIAGITAILLIGPILVEQAAAFATQIPSLLTSAYQSAAPWVERIFSLLGIAPASERTSFVAEAGSSLQSMAVATITGLLGGGLKLVNVLALLAVTPLAAFYMLRDWPKIIEEVDGWLPREYADTIREQAREVDRVLAGFARGAAIVCLAQGVFYAVALSLAGLRFGLLIGLAAGAVSFVPYLGSLAGLISSVGMALIQFWPELSRILIVAGIFVAGQVLQDWVLTPRIIGSHIGLSPLWVLFGLFAGGTLFGFVGMLVAVPACAVMGVIARFGITQYKESGFYRGDA